MSNDRRLERAAYTTVEWQEKEAASLFASAWVFAGPVEAFQKAGDFNCIKAGVDPIFVIRDDKGELTAFHNLCRHRGTELLEGDGNAGSMLVCPYHRWTYDLRGNLKGVPNLDQCFPDLALSAYALKPAAIGTFQNLLFVNPNPIAKFDSWILPIRDRAWPHEPGVTPLQEFSPLHYVMKCDWKVFVENAIDGYHLAYLHQRTFGGPSPSDNVWERYGEHMVWFVTDENGVRHSLPAKVRKEYRDANAKTIVGADQADYGGVYYLFPTTLIMASPYQFSVSSLVATGPGRCALRVRYWADPENDDEAFEEIPGFDAESGVISSDHWTIHPLESNDFQTEDVWICEKVQRGLASPGFEHGPIAKGAGAEEPISWFHELVLDRVG